MTKPAGRNVNTLDFEAIQEGAVAVSKLNGNVGANGTALSDTISLNATGGEFIAFRWNYDSDSTAAQSGLAVDDLNINFTTVAVPEPSAALLGLLGRPSCCVARVREQIAGPSISNPKTHARLPISDDATSAAKPLRSSGRNLSGPLQATIPIDQTSFSYSQDFNALDPSDLLSDVDTSGTGAPFLWNGVTPIRTSWQNDSTYDGWTRQVTVGGSTNRNDKDYIGEFANGTIRFGNMGNGVAGDGSLDNGPTSDRCVGLLMQGTDGSASFGVVFEVGPALTVTEAVVNYTGEQWFRALDRPNHALSVQDPGKPGLQPGHIPNQRRDGLERCRCTRLLRTQDRSRAENSMAISTAMPSLGPTASNSRRRSL